MNLSQHQAVGVVLKYKGLLLDARLAPATINTRLSAIKSLTSHARKLGQCRFSLEDIPQVRAEKYRDTSGVDATAYRAMLARVERTSFKVKQDYVTLRLLWDNALRRGYWLRPILPIFGMGSSGLWARVFPCLLKSQ